MESATAAAAPPQTWRTALPDMLDLDERNETSWVAFALLLRPDFPTLQALETARTEVEADVWKARPERKYVYDRGVPTKSGLVGEDLEMFTRARRAAMQYVTNAFTSIRDHYKKHFNPELQNIVTVPAAAGARRPSALGLAARPPMHPVTARRNSAPSSRGSSRASSRRPSASSSVPAPIDGPSLFSEILDPAEFVNKLQAPTAAGTEEPVALCIAVAGPTRAGKTFLTKAIIEKVLAQGVIETLVVLSGLVAPKAKDYPPGAQILPYTNEDFEDLVAEWSEKGGANPPTMVVLDDVTGLAEGHPALTQLFTEGRHFNTSVIVLGHVANCLLNPHVLNNATAIIFACPSSTTSTQLHCKMTLQCKPAEFQSWTAGMWPRAKRIFGAYIAELGEAYYLRATAPAAAAGAGAPDGDSLDTSEDDERPHPASYREPSTAEKIAAGKAEIAALQEQIAAQKTEIADLKAQLGARDPLYGMLSRQFEDSMEFA